MEGVERAEPGDTDFCIGLVTEIVRRPGDTDFGIDLGSEIVAGNGDSDFDMGPTTQTPAPPRPSPLGAGYLILVVRELTGMSQRVLARSIGTSQPTLATLETGNRVPSVRTLLRVADATGFELVIGLRRPNVPAPKPNDLQAQGFDLLGTLSRNTQDGLADFVVLREPSPTEGPR